MADILIVEDEGLVAMEIGMSLASLGHKVIGIFPSGSEALGFLKENTPDLILMDIRLKGDLNGIDTARIINDTNDVPIVYMTAYSDKDTIEVANTTNHAGFLFKPIADYQIKEMMNKTLGEK
jgi:CheY-like chemotaxis protein